MDELRSLVGWVTVFWIYNPTLLARESNSEAEDFTWLEHGTARKCQPGS